LAVILVVPMCLLCSVVGVAWAGMDINIFVQIGFVVLVGLASKNAILIVEFAKEKSAHGATPADATVEACRLRLRPIIMTSLAFILGVVPLAIAVGAGAEMRRTLGIAVFSGMLGVTLFGIFLTPSSLHDRVVLRTISTPARSSRPGCRRQMTSRGLGALTSSWRAHRQVEFALFAAAKACRTPVLKLPVERRRLGHEFLAASFVSRPET
jgi:predicted RND superfamily exporter protein